MFKSALINLILIFFLSPDLIAQKEIVVKYEKPYQYFFGEEQWLIYGYISNESTLPFSRITLEGKAVNFVNTDSGNYKLTLPLVGKTGEMVFYKSTGKGEQIITKQHFTPLISSEWGYFGSGKIDIVCSSHQDIAWMNTPDSCRHQRIYDIVIPALNMIDKYPGFRFEMEQTLNLMEILKEQPLAKQRIIDAYENGKFEWGATYIQPYEGLESGEQLIRQSYFGRKWIKDSLPGMDACVAFNVDVPGRSLQFPQILQKSGIDYLVISRLCEGFYNWYSPDGSKVLTYSPGNYGWPLLIYKYFEDDVVTAMQKLNKVLQKWDAYYSQRNIPPVYAVIISTDAGGPKSYQKIIDEWNEIATKANLNIPLIQQATSKEFLSAINVPEAEFDSISGERPDLWLYIHGPAHYEAIKAKKEAAVNLPAAEAFSSALSMTKRDYSVYPEKELNKAWSEAIYPDHGWGGKHGEITDSIFRAYYESANNKGRKILGSTLSSVAAFVDLNNSNNIILFNDLPWKRDGVASVDISDKKGNNWVILNYEGEIVPSFLKLSNQVKTITFYVDHLPALGYTTFTLKNGKTKQNTEIKAGSNYCENKFYKIELGEGGIRSLFDKELQKWVFNTTKFKGGDLLNLGYKGNGAGEFVQVHPTDGDGFENTGNKETLWELVDNNAVSSVFVSKYKMNGFTVIQQITVYHQLKRIDFEYDIPDWSGEHNRQLRAAFPLNMKDAQISYDVPMGIVNVGKDELNRVPGGWAWGGSYHQMPKDINPREIENFISASNEELGVTLSTNLAVADWVDPSRESESYPVLQGVLLSSHKSCHGEGNWYHQKGSHHFKLSFTSHKPSWQNGYNFGVGCNHPLLPVQIEKAQKGNLPDEISFLSVSSPQIKISAFKKTDNESSYIVRLVNMSDKDQDFELSIFIPVKEVCKCNMIEEEQQKIEGSGQKISLRIGKNAIETIKLKL